MEFVAVNVPMSPAFRQSVRELAARHDLPMAPYIRLLLEREMAAELEVA